MSERIPPSDLEAERAVLGCILLENDALNIVSEIPLAAKDFFADAHAKIYSAMSELFAAGQPVDGVTLRGRLAASGKLEGVGGDDYLLALTDTIPTVANIEAHAAIVHEKALVRSVITACHEIAARGYGDYGAATDFLDAAERGLGRVCETRKLGGKLRHIQGGIETVFEDLRSRAENKGGPAGEPTGFVDLDRYLSGLEPGLLYIMAGRPGMGKTAMGLNVLRNVAQSSGKPALFFSLEMPERQLVARLLASEALVDGGKIKDARLAREDWSRLATAAGTLSNLPIYIDDTPRHDVDNICRVARRKHREDGLSVIGIDYIQLATSTGKRHDSREQEVSYISQSLKGLAMELEIPVLALSQLNRGVESRQDKRPMISDLRESGAIEQDADTILFIYRDEFYHPSTSDRGLAEIIIGKQRSGPTGTVKTVFRKEFTRFESYNGGHAEEPASLPFDDGPPPPYDPTSERYA